jgi:cytochrome c5
MKNYFTLALLLLMVACVAKKAIIPTQSDVDRVASKFEGYTLNDLNHGKKLYEQHCGTCHSLKRPQSESEAGWRHEVPKMVQLTNKKNPNALDAQAEEAILRYLITMSAAPKK